jgi:4-azaleucine resistance transporter AzlC
MVANGRGAIGYTRAFFLPPVNPFPSPETRREFLAGSREVAPVLAGTVPFGFVAGVAGVAAGMTPLEAVALSVLTFSGIAQLVAAQLLAVGSPLPIIVAAVLVVGLRNLMYSASLAVHLAHLSRRWRIALSYLMTDQGFALGVRHFSSPGEGRERHWYLLGVSLTLWASWQAAVLAGAFAGAQVPSGLGLDFVVVLTFLALLVPAVRTRADLAAAVVAGATALAAAGLPYKLSLVAASISGIGAGLALEAWRRR